MIPRSEPPDPDAMQIDENLPFQRRFWVVERLSWSLMALFLLAAALGLFGGGWLAGATAKDPAGRFQVDFTRFERMERPTQLTLHFSRAPDQPSQTAIWLDREYAKQLHITEIDPPPDRVELAGDRLYYHYTLPRPGEEVTVIFNLEVQQAGRLRGAAGLRGGGQVRFRQLIYP